MSNKNDEYWNTAIDLHAELVDELIFLSAYLDGENAENIQNINDKLIEIKDILEIGIENLTK